MKRAPMPDVFAEPRRGATWLTTPPPRRKPPAVRLRAVTNEGTFELFTLDTVAS